MFIVKVIVMLICYNIATIAHTLLELELQKY